MNKKGFTLIELIITIAIIALIAAAVFVSVNPGLRLGNTKDSIRKSDVVAIEKAIQKAIVSNLTVPTTLAALTENTPYMIVTEGASTSGTSECATTDEKIARVDIVADFEDYIAGDIPVDEDATGDDTGYYITRVGNSFFINHCNAYGDTYVFSCEATLTDSRDSKTYDIVQIGEKCWMADNLNIGTRVDYDTNQTDNATIEKYCWNESEANCTIRGGLYQWDEANAHDASGCNGTGESQPECSSPLQGICPTGWHIPSHYELNLLQRDVCTSGSCSTDFPYNESTIGDRGTDEGTKLKVGGSSGFEGDTTGLRWSSGYINEDRLYIWSSSDGGGGQYWSMQLNDSISEVPRYKAIGENYGFSIRCVQD